MSAQSGLGFSGIAAIQIPDDGATGTRLTKQSPANYDYDWEPGVNVGNPDGVIYVLGDEDTDGSIRITVSPGGAGIIVEYRLDGEWVYGTGTLDNVISSCNTGLLLTSINTGRVIYSTRPGRT